MSSLAKNTALMMAGSIGQKIISLLYFAIVARTIGVSNTGLYTAALAMSTIFVVFVDLGFTNVFIREAAKEPDKIQTYFSRVLAAKMICGVLSYGALAATLRLLDFEWEFKQLVYISGLTMLFDSFHLTAYGALRAYGNLKYESIALAGSQFLTLVLGSLFLSLRLPLYFLILAFTTASAANAIFAGFVLRRRYGLSLCPSFDRAEIKKLAYLTLPFALAAIFGRIYSYVDVVLLKKLASNAAVGYYSTPSKITFAFQFIPLALIASLYPRFSEYFVRDREKLAQMFAQSLKYLGLIALPLTVGIFILAPDIIVAAFTAEFLPSVLPLRILIISLLFSFISFPIGAFLNATNRQTMQTAITACVLAANITANLLLIPRYGAAGAAAAALLGNLLLGAVGYALIPTIARIPHAFIARSFLSLSAAAALMGAAVWYLNRTAGLWPAVVGGAASYAGLLFITKALSWPDVKELIGLLKAR